MKITRGSIWLANLGKPDAKTSIQKNTRPVIIVSNEMCNVHSPVITAVPLTTRNKNNLHNKEIERIRNSNNKLISSMGI